ncbi:hypothetical protein PHYBLDRAFT_161838 [Phycomyces blakesleeanus NRRL 1555(-)]|uniref:Uncharacterized protein n=1 Tax=Phycomyces blakesleeanus (strain ATCC 8743b / DSM 1359 / FGSC 10004 / NBRC 33097 / NRRL 1555) TaxID=763407 RepID=A0A167RAA6_PHYB8|nr:hypothetical protein PHYBLDRAFT_161838 [Phycomyces blakesleeanus NRRL 1555(-)]OAD81214.1 hypothetical protein PHYBLDRAFT_161838 [Phycomyces blakesleeanus NRRL 1555(-)]|eukprot:XP_018299254.1 hypothetical protein PHYBLDRAFT_161838 [Phycomyces blakesleeanus NRRL 1555(-)]
MSKNLNNNSVNNAFGEEPSVGSPPRNTNDIRTIMLQHSQGTVSNQRQLAPKRARLNLESDLSGRTRNIHDVVLNTVLKNTSSEKAEATASNTVEQDMLPGHQPTLDIVRHIGNRKLQEKKTGEKKQEENRRACLCQQRVKSCERRQSALKASRVHFVNSFGKNVDSILHADYMSDLESDDKREEEEQDSSSEKSFFWRFCPSWRSEEGDRFVDELDVDYEAAHDKKNNTCPFKHKFKEIRDKQLSKTKANKLPSWSKKQ